MSEELLYFNGVSPRGSYLTPPAPWSKIAEALRQGGWNAPPDWVLEWTRQHAVDDPKRLPVLETERPWDLAETGWAVVFAPGLDPRARAGLAELLEHRRTQAARYHTNYYRECEHQGESAFNFLKKMGAKPGMNADPDNFPYYVLLVGSPESLPFKFQSELDVNHAVGRIWFERNEDYARYAHSVVQAEDQARLRPRQIAFFATEHKNDPATQQTAHDLVEKLSQSVLTPKMPWQVRTILGAEARKERLSAILGGGETPALLFAACHGVGFEEEDGRQEACQGALVCQDWPGPDDEEGVDDSQWFAASDVAERAALHGLVAFFYACYGLGTPQRDSYDQEALGKPRVIAPRPLVSRLPQRLLCHPAGGALAVIGHVDRAWPASFAGSPQGEGVGPFLFGLRRLLQGHTVGWAMEYLNQSYAALAAMQGNMDEDRRNREPVDEDLFSHLWLLRNDARNFQVLGDPAVRLPGAGEPR
jgi:hypothetical protein